MPMDTIMAEMAIAAWTQDTATIPRCTTKCSDDEEGSLRTASQRRISRARAP